MSPRDPKIRRTGRPTGADAEATRRRILSAALSLFSQWGYDATRVKDVALKAGVNAALVHHYFGDKDALYDTVLLDALQPLTILGQGLLVRGLPTDLLLAAWVEVLFAYFEKHRDILWLITRECMGHAGRVRGVVVEALSPIFKQTAAAIESGHQTSADMDASYLVINTLGMLSVWFTHNTLIDVVLEGDSTVPSARMKQRDQIMKLLTNGVLGKR
mgnify:CR=1 FL=1